MDNHDPKTQINKSEVIHDLNNLNYLLRTLARLIDGAQGLPPDVKRLSMGAIATTDKLISKLGGTSKSTDNASNENTGGLNG